MPNCPPLVVLARRTVGAQFGSTIALRSRYVNPPIGLISRQTTWLVRYRAKVLVAGLALMFCMIKFEFAGAESNYAGANSFSAHANSNYAGAQSHSAPCTIAFCEAQHTYRTPAQDDNLVKAGAGYAERALRCVLMISAGTGQCWGREKCTGS